LPRSRAAAELPAAAGGDARSRGVRGDRARRADAATRPRPRRAAVPRTPRTEDRPPLSAARAADGARALRLAHPLRRGLSVAAQLARPRSLFPPRAARRLAAPRRSPSLADRRPRRGRRADRRASSRALRGG